VVSKLLSLSLPSQANIATIGSANLVVLGIVDLDTYIAGAKFGYFYNGKLASWEIAVNNKKERKFLFVDLNIK